MPVEADQLTIINAALLLIGDEPLVALSDTGEASDIANALYEIRLAEALGTAHWRFATRQVLLVNNGTAPLARWTTAWDLPDGTTDPIPMTILAVTALDTPIEFDRYENQIFCNAGADAELYLDYSYRAAEADFTGRFRGAFVDLLAADFCFSKDPERALALSKSAYAKFKASASMDAQERTSRKLPVQRFLAGRRGWNAGRSGGGISVGSSGTVSDADYGEITVSGGVWTLNDDVLGVEHFANGTAGDMLYWGADTIAAILPAGTNGYILKMSGGVPVWSATGAATVADGDYGDITVSGTGTVFTIDNTVVTLAKMQDIGTDAILGRTTAGSGSIETLTPTDVTAMLDAFTSGLQGLTPASGGGTSNFLRADGTWAAPATGGITRGTAVNTTSGTSVDITGIASGANQITITFAAVSTNGTSNLMLQLGTSGGFETTGYVGTVDNGGGSDSETTGIVLSRNVAATDKLRGQVILSRHDGNTWVWSGAADPGGDVMSCAGDKSLSAELTQIRLTTVGGSNTFDNGAMNSLVL